MKFSEITKRLVHERAKGRCELCGVPADNFQLHHRRPRGMGGSKRDETGAAANALLVHPKCHTWIESNRKEAMKYGYLVSQWADPREVPVYRARTWVLLDDEGAIIQKDQRNLEYQTTRQQSVDPLDSDLSLENGDESNEAPHAG